LEHFKVSGPIQLVLPNRIELGADRWHLGKLHVEIKLVSEIFDYSKGGQVHMLGIIEEATRVLIT